MMSYRHTLWTHKSIQHLYPGQITREVNGLKQQNMAQNPLDRDLPVLQVPKGWNPLRYILQKVIPATNSILHNLNLGDVNAIQAAGVNMRHLSQSVLQRNLGRRCQEVYVGGQCPTGPMSSVRIGTCTYPMPVTHSNTGNFNICVNCANRDALVHHVFDTQACATCYTDICKQCTRRRRLEHGRNATTCTCVVDLRNRLRCTNCRTQARNEKLWVDGRMMRQLACTHTRKGVVMIDRWEGRATRTDPCCPDCFGRTYSRRIRVNVHSGVPMLNYVMRPHDPNRAEMCRVCRGVRMN